MVAPFEQLEGVIKVVCGYTGGYKENPAYEEVCSGTTGHFESVQITFDPRKISYQILLDIFWQQIDPTDAGGQFQDRGSSYRTAIFYHNGKQRQAAEDSRRKLNQSNRFPIPAVTLILPALSFYRAEKYHQNYHSKNPQHYRQYQIFSGREAFLKKMWN